MIETSTIFHGMRWSKISSLACLLHLEYCGDNLTSEETDLVMEFCSGNDASSVPLELWFYSQSGPFKPNDVMGTSLNVN